MRTYVALFMPVIWAFVAAGLALLLYRTSQAVFLSDVKTKGRRQQLGLVGSVVIFGVIFLGLGHYSPGSLMKEMQEGRVRIPLQDLEALDAALGSLEGAGDELNACLQVSTLGECKSQWNEVQARIARVRGANARVSKTAE